MQKICLINGSLRGEKATSLALLKDIGKRLNAAGFGHEVITVRAGLKEGYSVETMRAVGQADAVVIVFPLFSYSLPGTLTDFFEEYYRYVKTALISATGAKVFAVINCGFPEAKVCAEAIRVIKNICARLGLRYRFSIAIGSGPVTALTMKAPFLNPGLKRAFRTIVRDIGSSEPVERKDCYFNPILPKSVILKIKDHYEKKMMTRAEGG
jgi:multimeric flavodoxin WrbA